MPTFKIKLHTKRPLKSGLFGIVLQIVHNRKPTTISLGYECSLADWDKEKGIFKRTYKGYQTKNRILRKVMDKVDTIMDEFRLSNKPFSIDLFRKHFINAEVKTHLLELIDIIANEFHQLDKISSRDIYRTLKNRIIAFQGSKKEIPFTDIDKRFLERFEFFLRTDGVNDGGIKHYLKYIRSIYNRAIERGYAKEENYPFTTARNKNGYSFSHLKSTATPRAISIEEMDRIKQMDISLYPKLQQAHLYLLFSYYTRGMNFTDMAYLKWTDIYNGRIHYTRSKTKGTFNISVSDNIQNILDQFLPKINDYIFPILSDFHQSAAQQKNRINKCRRKFNTDLKEIAKICAIEANLTSYVIRHTFATTLKQKNVDIAKISESLGHSDINTTKAYLKNFENSELDKLDELL